MFKKNKVYALNELSLILIYNAPTCKPPMSGQNIISRMLYNVPRRMLVKRYKYTHQGTTFCLESHVFTPSLVETRRIKRRMLE